MSKLLSMLVAASFAAVSMSSFAAEEPKDKPAAEAKKDVKKPAKKAAKKAAKKDEAANPCAAKGETKK